MTAAIVVFLATVALVAIYCLYAARTRQRSIQALIDKIGTILKDPALSTAEVRHSTSELISRIRALDSDGTLQPLVDDTENYVAEQLAGRNH